MSDNDQPTSNRQQSATPAARRVTLIVSVEVAQALHRMQQLHNLGDQQVLIRLRDWQIVRQIDQAD